MNTHTPNLSASNLLATRALLVSLSISSWSARKHDRSATDQIHQANQADSDAGRYNKLLLPKDALKDIQSIVNATRTDFIERTLPWANDGMRIMSATGYLAHVEWFRKQQTAFDKAVNEFVQNYERHVAAREKALGALFNPHDYPTQAEIKRRFCMTMTNWPVPSSDDFRVNISDTQADQIRQEIEASVKSATDNAVRDVYRRVSDVLERMVERLNAYKPATKKGERPEGVFRDSLVENVKDLINILPSLNITGDEKLAAMANQLRPLTSYEPSTLRQNTQARTETAQAAQAVLDSVKDYLA